MAAPSRDRSRPWQKLGLLTLSALLSLLLLELTLQAVALAHRTARDRPEAAQKIEEGEYRILCLGESTTHGFGETPYTHFLQEELNRRDFGVRFRVIQAGFPGAHTSTVTGRLPELIAEHRPHMVITMMGINDQFYFSEAEALSLPIEVQLVLLKSRVYKLTRLAWVDLKRRFDAGASAPSSPVQNPNHWRAYATSFNLAHAAWRQGRSEGVEQSLLDVIRMARETSRWSDPADETVLDVEPVYLRFYTRAYLDLGEFYLSRGRAEDAVALYEEAIARHPDTELFYRVLAGIHDQLGNDDGADAYRRRSRELASRRILGITKSGYAAARRILRAEAIPFVAMQYPLRSVETLKYLLDDAKEVIYVDNESLFLEEVASLGYDALFIDHFAGDFGHCTELGNRLIAENLVVRVFEPVFGSAQMDVSASGRTVLGAPGARTQARARRYTSSRKAACASSM